MNKNNQQIAGAVDSMAEMLEAELMRIYGVEHACTYIISVRLPNGDGRNGFLFVDNIIDAAGTRSFLLKLIEKYPPPASYTAH